MYMPSSEHGQGRDKAGVMCCAQVVQGQLAEGRHWMTTHY